MTLVELLLAMAITVIIFGVVTAAFAMAVRLHESTRVQLAESHDSQLTAAYLPADLLSTGTGTIETATGLDSGCATTPSGWNVLRLRWNELEGASTRNYVAAYRVQFAAGEWQLVRVACSAVGVTTSTTPVLQIVARNLRAVSTSADLPTVATSGAKVTITVTDASGYTYALTGTRRTTAAAAVAPTLSPTPSPSPSPLPPVISTVELRGTAAGDVGVEVTFSEPVPDACLSRFTLSGLPSSRGSYTGPAVRVSAEKVRLPINRGSNAPNTAIDTLRMSFAGETASCPASSVTDATPADAAAPVLVSFVTTNKASGFARKLEDGDGLTFAYSEPVTNLPASLQVQLIGSNGSNADSLMVTGLFQAPAPLRADYVEPNNKTATASGPRSTTDRASTAVLTIATCSGNSCANPDDLRQAGGTATLTFTQVTGLTDAAGNSLSSRGLTPAATTITDFGAF